MKPLYNAAAAAKVAKRLNAWCTQSLTGKINRRVQVTDPQLCHDVLQRLAPSLERHKGCDLIDVNPGIGLWSEHLHEIVQPRRHILVEADKDLFGSHLDALVQKAPEKYQWTDQPLAEVIKGEDFLGKNTWQHGLTRVTTENPQLLLNINLAGPVGKIRRDMTARLDSYFFNNLYASLFGLRDNLYERGLFRVLAWTPDNHKYVILPRTVEQRSRQSLQLDNISHVTEVAGAAYSRETEPSSGRRLIDLELEDFKALESATLAMPGGIPTNRGQPLPLPPVVHLHPSVPTWLSTPHSEITESTSALIDLDSQVKAKYPDKYASLASIWATHENQSGRRLPKLSDPIYKEWTLLYRQARSVHNQYMAGRSIALDHHALESQWASSPNPTTDDRTFQTTSTALTKRLTKTLRQQDQRSTLKTIDDARLLTHRASSWYRRPYNPLTTTPSDFANDKPLALLDIQPNPSFRTVLDTEAKWRCYDLLLFRLSPHLAKDVPTALNTLLSAGVEEFLETVPALRDVRRGGWWDLSQLRCRSLGPELWMELARAYEEWPFRLTDEELWNEDARVRRGEREIGD